MPVDFKEQEQDTDTVFIRGVPAKVKQAFKAKCANADVTMQEALIWFMGTINTDQLKDNIDRQRIK